MSTVERNSTKTTINRDELEKKLNFSSLDELLEEFDKDLDKLSNIIIKTSKKILEEEMKKAF